MNETHGRETEVPFMMSDEVIMYNADHFVTPEPDKLTFVIIQALDDNTLELRCLEDSTYHTMIVESAYTPEYYPGITLIMIKP